MDNTTGSNFSLKDNANGKNDETSDTLLKDTSSNRSTISKVSLRLPFKSDTFKAQSLLARFHSSRKSDSGIKSEFKATNNGTGLGLGRGWKKPGNGAEVSQSAGIEPENTSASLPDDLNQNSTVDVNTSSVKSGITGVCRTKSNEQETCMKGCMSEDSPFLPTSNNQKGTTESWFDTWPGRPKKLKSLRKRLLTSGTNNKSNTVPTQINRAEINTKNDGNELRLPPEELKTAQTDDDSSVLKCYSTREVESGDAMTSTVPSLAAGHHVSLDALLESLPLVYDPSTRQLCLGATKRGKNDFSSKIMSNLNKFEHSECDSLEQQRLETEQSVLEEDAKESHSEALLKYSEAYETSSLLKPLEIIQEVDENGETVRLIDKNTPQSGNVSGSSSLERGRFESPRNSLQRVGTNNSLSVTDASSFSSLSSSNTEFSGYSASDSAVCLGSQQSDTCSLRDLILTDNDGKTKKKGITDFLTR